MCVRMNACASMGVNECVCADGWVDEFVCGHVSASVDEFVRI